MIFGGLVLVVGFHALPLRAQTPQAHVRHVDIQLFTFAPAMIEVEQGDSVEWTNSDLVPHTATADDNAWTTGEIRNGATGLFMPKSVGTYEYHCQFHPQMKGVIVVVERGRSR